MKRYMQLVVSDARLVFGSHGYERDEVGVVAGRHVVWYLDDGYNRAYVLDKLRSESLPYGTSLTEGMRSLVQDLGGDGPVYSETNGDRRDAKDYVFLLTNRRQLSPYVGTLARELKAQGLLLVGVGFGDAYDVDLDSLRRASSDPSYMVHVSSYDLGSLSENKDATFNYILHRDNCPRDIPGKGSSSGGGGGNGMKGLDNSEV